MLGTPQTATSTSRTSAPRVRSVIAARYSRMASSMLASASASVAPCDQHPGRPGAWTLKPSSDRSSTTLYFMAPSISRRPRRWRLRRIGKSFFPGAPCPRNRGGCARPALPCVSPSKACPGRAVPRRIPRGPCGRLDFDGPQDRTEEEEASEQGTPPLHPRCPWPPAPSPAPTATVFVRQETSARDRPPSPRGGLAGEAAGGQGLISRPRTDEAAADLARKVIASRSSGLTLGCARLRLARPSPPACTRRRQECQRQMGRIEVAAPLQKRIECRSLPCGARARQDP